MFSKETSPLCLISTYTNTWCKLSMSACQLQHRTCKALRLSHRPHSFFHCRWSCTWPASAFLFAWNLCIQKQARGLHLVAETVNYGCESGYSTGLPGAARFPSNCGRLGCTLRGSTCTCQMLFSLSFPNLLWVFVLSEQKDFLSQKTLHFFLHIAFNVCTKIRNVLLFSLLLLSLMSSKALVLAFRYLLVCESFVSLKCLYLKGKFIKSIFMPHNELNGKSSTFFLLYWSWLTCRAY